MSGNRVPQPRCGGLRQYLGVTLYLLLSFEGVSIASDGFAIDALGLAQNPYRIRYNATHEEAPSAPAGPVQAVASDRLDAVDAVTSSWPLADRLTPRATSDSRVRDEAAGQTTVPSTSRTTTGTIGLGIRR